MTKKPPRRDPIIVYKREEKGLKPFLPKGRDFRFGAPQQPQQKSKKPKETKPVAPERLSLHHKNIAEIEALPSPEKEIATACYYMCFLVHETKTSADLFPLKHNTLEKIFKSGHNCLTVNYVRRGDREIYHLSPEAKKSWETETSGNKHHVRMYLTPKCKIELEEGYFDLYHFHIVMEPFRFSFYLPIHQAPWLDKRRLSKRRFHYPQTVEYGLAHGKLVTTSRKATMVSLEKIKEELNKLMDLEMEKKSK
ncbi:MAG: hypothetical protein WCG29_02560 [Desulfomonile sp.]|nr:hypothetical protein [Deltaproteobacteria bacterium]